MNANKLLLINPRHFGRLLLCLCLLAVVPYSWAAQIQVTVDRNPVNLNDSFQIVFTATEEPDDDPDFSPLAQDFSILHQNHGSTASWVNGQHSRVLQWTLNVMAKTAGTVQVPAIHFGADVTTPLTVQVQQEAKTPDAQRNDELFLTAEATPTQTYNQAQIIYTVRVYTRVEISRAQLSEPELADAVIEKIGEDANYNTDVNGVGYSVTERKYAIFAQKSGTLTVKPLVLTAEVLSAGRSVYNNFFSPPVAKTKRVESPAVSLDIKAAPAAAAGQHWLPAEQLELTETWSGDPAQMHVGEPLTRTLKIQAKGTTVGQLPELAQVLNNADLKAYPDQPNLKEQKNADGLVALREEKIALIPSKPGRYVLPAMTLPWFNTQTQQMAVATLPEVVLTVVAGANEALAASVPAPPTLAAPPSAAQTPSVAAPALPPAASADTVLPWSLAAFMALGWLVTLVYLWRGKAKPVPVVDEVQAARQLRLRDIVKQLRTACADNDAAAAQKALLAWGSLQFNANTLGAIANQCEARLRDEIILLNQTLYGRGAQTWQGKHLFQFFTENNARTKLATAKRPSELQPLHRL